MRFVSVLALSLAGCASAATMDPLRAQVEPVASEPAAPVERPVDSVTDAVSADSLALQLESIRDLSTQINRGLRDFDQAESDMTKLGLLTDSVMKGRLLAYTEKGELRKVIATHYGVSGYSILEIYYRDEMPVMIGVTDVHRGDGTGTVTSRVEEVFYFARDGALIRKVPTLTVRDIEGPKPAERARGFQVMADRYSIALLAHRSTSGN